MAEKKRYHGTHHHRTHEKHQTMRDRVHEGVGEEMHMRREKHYTGKHDSEGMIHNDYGSIANMPPHAMVKYWPKCEDSLLNIPSDDIRGIDRQVDQSVRSIERNRMAPKKN